MSVTPQQLTPQLLARTNLNLGCGDFPIEGALNVDIRSDAQCDVVLDLNDPQALLQLPHQTYSKITMFHVLEHLDDVFGTMRSCEQLLAPGGEIHIRVPHFSRGFTHSEHRHGFDVGFRYYFEKRLSAFYYGPELDFVRLRLDWAIRFDIYRMVVPGWQAAIVQGLNAVITPLANLSPGFCSRIWCYWVGGFEQIEYVFRKRATKVE